MMTLRPLRFAAIGLVVLVGCGPTPTTPPAGTTATQTEQKEPTLYTAKQCFSSMVNLAQRWQPDALPFHVESELTAETPGQGGKSTIWRAMFASQSRGTMKSFVCSGSREPSAPARGYTSSAETAYPPNVPGLLFDPSYFQDDSDKAFATTLEHGGAAIIKQDPKQPITYLLDWDHGQKVLLWTIIYGKSQADRKGVCVVNAATGAFVRAGK
ncbi:MAG TPA: hypothetical protein VEH30_13670 [Terriglobales bacterium]|nr:hypothetical protein [Terriglobales bacterium]